MKYDNKNGYVFVWLIIRVDEVIWFDKFGLKLKEVIFNFLFLLLDFVYRKMD